METIMAAANVTGKTNYTCRRCRLSWNTQQEYHEHLTTSEFHHVCIQCNADFLSPKALQHHNFEMHQIDQDLKCKCGMTFVRAAGLVAHLSQKLCIGAASMSFELARIQLVHQNSNQTMDPIQKNGGAQKTRVWVDDFNEDPIIFLHVPPDNGLSHDNAWSTAQIYGQILSEASVAVKSTTETQPSVRGTNPSFLGGSNDFTPVEEPRPISDQQIQDQMEYESRVRAEKKRKNPFHPNCPDFNPSKYWNNFIKQYTCPYPRCKKSKPTLGAFLAHLVSPAHSETSVACKVCLRTFSSPAAFAAHLEANSKRCRATKDMIADLINPITAGLIQVVGEGKNAAPVFGAWVAEAGGDLAAQAQLHEMTEQQKRDRIAAENADYAASHPQW